MKGRDDSVLATNRRALQDYFIDERYEAGLVLTGSEIKAVRAGQVNLKESYVTTRNGQAWLIGSHISPYNPSSRDNHDPLRDRRLLLHRREIAKLVEQVKQKGYTLVPLKI